MLFFSANGTDRPEIIRTKSEIIPRLLRSGIISDAVFFFVYKREYFPPHTPLVSAIVTWDFGDRQEENITRFLLLIIS